MTPRANPRTRLRPKPRGAGAGAAEAGAEEQGAAGKQGAARRTGPFRSLSRAMALGLLRDRMAVFFTLVFPLMFLLLFGALLQGDSSSEAKIVQVGDVAVLDDMPDAERARLRGVLSIEKTDGSAKARAQALEKVRKGDVDAAVFQREAPRDGDDRDAADGKGADREGTDGEGTDGKDTDGKGGARDGAEAAGIELRYSAADSVRSGSVHGIVNSVIQQANQQATGQPPAFQLHSAQLEDESTKPIQYLTPGLLGWSVAMSGVFGSAFNLVNWRKKRILRRLWLAPVSARTVIGARVGVNLTLALAQTAVFLGVASLPYYGLRLTGHWWLCVPLVVCGTLAFMSIGLVVGSWAKTEEAANGLAQLVILPMAFLSGSFFPLDAAPGWVRAVSEFLPLKHLAEAMQDVLSRGGGWGAALPVMGGLLAFAAVLALVASRLFRWDDA